MATEKSSLLPLDNSNTPQTGPYVDTFDNTIPQIVSKSASKQAGCCNASSTECACFTSSTPSHPGAALPNSLKYMCPVLSKEWYSYMIRRSWIDIILFSILLYILTAVTVGLAYYCIGLHCGASVSLDVALYFFSVSIFNNGGYLGEDPKFTTSSVTLATQPKDHYSAHLIDGRCYQLRAYLVFVTGFTGMLLCSVLCAIIIAKGTSPTLYRNRILFSQWMVLRRHSIMPLNDGQMYKSSIVKSADNEKMDKLEKTTDEGSLENLYYQFRIANMGAISNSGCGGGTLNVYFTTHVTENDSVSTRITELSWCALEEVNNDNNVLKLWFPVTIEVTLPPSLNISSYTTHSITVEFSGKDEASNTTFVTRKIYYPKVNIVEGYRFRDNNCCCVSEENYYSNGHPSSSVNIPSTIVPLKIKPTSLHEIVKDI